MLADIMRQALSAIGALLIAGGGGALVAWWLVRTYAEGWLNSKFEQQLQSRQHDQEREIERLRFQINSMFDRKTKLHHREFEIVPEAWSKLVEAYNQVAGFIHVFQQYANVSKMDPAQLDEFLKNSKLTPWQQSELKSASDKDKVYREAIFFQRDGECRTKCRELHVYTKSNGIFLPENIQVAFMKLDGVIWNALIEHEITFEHNIPPPGISAKSTFETEGKQLLDEIEKQVRQRLWEDIDLK